MKDETAFRERMLDVTARLEENSDHTREAMERHAQEDREEFRRIHKRLRVQNRRMKSMGKQVTQTVNTSRYNWGVVWAWASAVVGVLGIAGTVWAIIK